MGNWVVSFSNAIVAYLISGTNPFTAVAFDRGGPAEAVQSSSLPSLGFHVAHLACPSTVNPPVELSRSVWLTTSISPRPLQEPLPPSVGIHASWHGNPRVQIVVVHFEKVPDAIRQGTGLNFLLQTSTCRLQNLSNILRQFNTIYPMF